MFRVKWVTHSQIGMTATENAVDADLDKLAYSCIERLPEMRKRASGMRPDGFLIFNDQGLEVRRWFGSPSPQRQAAQFPIKHSPGTIDLFSDETASSRKTVPQDGRRSRS